ncbi:MAG: DNA polymerase III subunit delta [Candidatus Aminicenantes bacterium 4484_214]|nr:MAG: DNA polymerase III subunit delta [Candidatus Aminicenantes bacterium 4484_214]RLE05100.1 MAG: DNA polymerase III subunit delta [Candidatus Aminicenantes bacterium]
MYRFSVLKKFKGEKIAPFYFLYGEEEYLGRLVLEEIKAKLSNAEQWRVEKFDLKNLSWPEVIDVAQISQGLFVSRRLLLLSGEYRDKDEEKQKNKERKKSTGWSLNKPDKKAIEDYLAFPNPGSIISVLLVGEPKRIEGTSLYRFLKSFSPGKIVLLKLQAFPEEKKKWIHQEFRSRGKTIEEEALERMMELVGSDLNILYQEIEKITLFIGDKNKINIDDVNQIAGWMAEVDIWDLEEHLEKGEVAGCIKVLDRLLSQGIKEEYILHQLAKALKNIFLGKQLIQERKSQREVFKLVKPYLKENFSFYPQKLASFIAAVDGLSFAQLEAVFQSLKEADIALKQSGLPPEVVLENFFLQYGQIRGTT